MPAQGFKEQQGKAAGACAPPVRRWQLLQGGGGSCRWRYLGGGADQEVLAEPGVGRVGAIVPDFNFIYAPDGPEGRDELEVYDTAAVVEGRWGHASWPVGAGRRQAAGTHPGS